MFGGSHIGGPYQSIPALLRAQQELGLQVALLTVPGGFSGKDLSFPVFYKSRLSLNYRLEDLPEPFAYLDLINFHCYYQWEHAIWAMLANRNGIPYIITPRGSMTQGAQSHRRLKKIFGNLIFQDDMVAKASAIHCLTEGEASDARKWQRPVFVVPNGADLSMMPVQLSTDLAIADRELHMLFLGRLDIQHKGLEILVEGLAAFRAENLYTKLRLLLAGPDYNSDMARLRTMVQQLGLADMIQIPGPLTGRRKEEAFAWAHIFVHTSRYEGQPMSVLEALAHGLPCFLTPGTNLAEKVANAGAGWCAQPTPAGLVSELTKVISSRAAIPLMGRAARALAEREFSWLHVAQQMIDHYTVIVRQ